MADPVWVKAISPDILRPVQGLQGRWGRYVTPSTENWGMVFGLGELQPGEVAGWHEHADPEIFFVLEGEGEALWRLNGQEHRAPLRPGTAFFKIGGIPHQMRNTSADPFRGVYFKIAES